MLLMTSKQLGSIILVSGLITALLTLITACRSAPAPNWQWERVEAGLPRRALVTAVAADPTDGDRLWAGLYAAGGLASSADGGQSWQTGADGLADNPIFDLLAPPPSERRAEGEVWAATRDGLFVSQEDGEIWQAVTEELPAVAVFALAVDGTGRLYAGLDDAGVYAETSDGWEPLGTDETLATTAVIALDVSADGQQIYAGTAGAGIFASRDGGQTWRAAYPERYAPNISLNPTDPTQAVASLRDELVRTQDGGQSWHTLPVEWAQAEVVSLLWLADGTLGAGTGRGDVYRSMDGGDSWQAGQAGLSGNGGVLDLALAGRQFLAAGWTGVYGSQAGGETWRELAPSLGTPQAQTLLATERGLLLGTRTGLYRWQTASETWEPLPFEFPPGGLQSLAADPLDETRLYAGTAGDGLYRSDDGGRSWERLPGIGFGIPALAVDPANRDHLYILAAWERVYESKDGGQTWLANWDGLGETLETTSLAVTPANGGSVVYAGAETGLFRSRNGEDWEWVAQEIVDQSVLALLIQPTPPASGGSPILYIGATRGVYRSLDQGQTVQSCTHDTLGWGCGLENISVTALLADPNHQTHLYAGTAYNGVYRSTDSGHTWQPIGPPDLSNDVVESLAWGPEGALFVAAESGVWHGGVE